MEAAPLGEPTPAESDQRSDMTWLVTGGAGY
ncbi:MAG: hypothetical protein K0S49_2816, partial [Microbacterium sp.]|nr:hypothetical protein [Microbacterium sp.]